MLAPIGSKPKACPPNLCGKASFVKLWLYFFLTLNVSLFSLDGTSVFVETNGAKLFCTVLGQGEAGREPLIVLHGGPGMAQDYLRPYMDKLAEGRQVIYYDQRGGGRSECDGAAEKLSLEVSIEDLDAVRREFGFEKVSILGHSWGGLVAMRYAAAHPEAVNKLILLNSMTASSEDFSLFVAEWTRRMAPFIADISADPELSRIFGRRSRCR